MSATLASGENTGAINGTYAHGLNTLDQLGVSQAVRVTQGPGWSSDLFIVSNFKGVLGNLKVRQGVAGG